MMQWLRRLLLAVSALLLCLVAVLWWLTEDQPLVASKPGLLFSDLKRAQSLAEQYRPSQMQAGQRYVVSLSSRELNLLAISALSAFEYGHLANVHIEVSDDQARLQASLPLLKNSLKRWVNISAEYRIQPGSLPRQMGLSIAGYELPQWVNDFLEKRWLTALPQKWVGLWQAAEVKLSSIDQRVLIGFTWIPQTTLLLNDFYLPDDAVNQATAKRVIRALQSLSDQQLKSLPLNDFLAHVILQVMPDAEALPVMMVALAQYISGNPIGPLYAVSDPTPPVIALTLSGRRDLARHYLISATLASQTGDSFAGQLGYMKELSDADNRSTGFSASDLLANQGGILFFHRLKRAVDRQQLPAFIRDLDQDLLPSKAALSVIETDWDQEDIGELMSVFVALPFYQVDSQPARRR